MPDKPCEDCGGTVFHHPDCARRDVVAVRVEAEQGLREIVARQGPVVDDELQEARRLRADDIALLARIHLTLARALGCGVHDRGPEECATRLVADRDRLEELVKVRGEDQRRVVSQLDALLKAANAVLDLWDSSDDPEVGVFHPITPEEQALRLAVRACEKP